MTGITMPLLTVLLLIAAESLLSFKFGAKERQLSVTSPLSMAGGFGKIEGTDARRMRLYSTTTFDASGVRMYRGESVEQFETEGSSLVATRPFDSGDIICEIPFSMCILAHVSGAIRGGSMMGQQDMIWEAAGDLRESVSEEDYLKGRTWDVQLALIFFSVP